MKYITLLILISLSISCNDPNVDPSTFQELYFKQENVNINIQDVDKANYNVQVLLNTRRNAERVMLIIKGSGEINGIQTSLTIDINSEISALTLNTDFSYSLIIDEATPINTLVNCSNDNPFSSTDELSAYVESKKTFKWDDDKQLYSIDLEALNGLLPEVVLPSTIIYQSAGTLVRTCD